MNDEMMNEGFWSVQNKVWLQMALWMEWMRPFLYFLLAIALLSLLLTLFDLAMLCWNEFHSPSRQQMKATPKAAGETKSAASPVCYSPPLS